MSRESHRQFLERTALRQAQKAIVRSGRDNLKKEDLARLRIQTLEPWTRILLLVFGLLFIGAGVLVSAVDVRWLALLLFISGGFGVFAAIVGRKKTITAALDGIDVLQLFEGLF